MTKSEQPQFHSRYPLKNLTTFGIGGDAAYFIEITDVAAMQMVLPYCQQRNLLFFILGKGSNVLFDDRGFSGVVIANRINFIDQLSENIWHVGAGYSFSLLGTQTARQGFSGLEFASGIPGSVGGAVYMNAGANGSETCQTLVSVDFVTPEGQWLCLSKDDLHFGYRYSSFQDKVGAIVGATFQLTPSPEAREKQLKIIKYRKKTQPYNSKSAGCIFRNPPLGYAGALIEQSGLKGCSIGEAQVSTLHANFIINQAGASAADVIQLVTFVQRTVEAQTGVMLESEVRFVPCYTHSS
jgi:UDP-N-acetylmuramate dehydrogenase